MDYKPGIYALKYESSPCLLGLLNICCYIGEMRLCITGGVIVCLILGYSLLHKFVKVESCGL